MRFSTLPALLLQLLLFLSVTKLHAGFDLTIEPEAGFQTNVPDGPSDSTFGNYFFCALGLEPSWTTDTGRAIRLMLTTPLNATKYFGGSGELGIAPELSLEKTDDSHMTTVSLGAAYHSSPATYDPTMPENYLEFSLGGERENSLKIPITGMYEFSLLNDLSTYRIDAKNALHLKISRSNAAHTPAFIKIGCALNSSTTQAAGYVQPIVAGGMTIPVNEGNLLLLQLFAAYSIYKPAEEPVQIIAGRGRWAKKTDTLVTYELTEPRIPFASLYCGYDRELTQHLNVHFYYMAALFGRGQPGPLLLSHQAGIMFSWYNK